MALKGLALFSGGLDSLLAIKLLQEQGQEIEAVHLALPFAQNTTVAGLSKVRATAAQVGVALHILAPDEELAEIVARPKFGHGKHFNPCQDCRIYQLRRSAELMPIVGASYLVTGEVVGQRPMSQRREALFITDRETGLKGLVLRPLSALHLPPTIPEERGWVDRSRLLGLAGRGRAIQEAMARAWGLVYPPPAGGCLLTHREYAARYRNLLDLLGQVALIDIPLVGLGRHFRLSPRATAIVGRNQSENRELARQFRHRHEARCLMHFTGVPGPLTLVLGTPEQMDLAAAAALTVRYADSSPAMPKAVALLTTVGRHPRRGSVEPTPLAEARLEAWRVN